MSSTFFDTLQPVLMQALSNLRSQFALQPQHFLLAVSGGVDSVVLVDLFHRSGLPFSIAHFDHGLRVTSESDAQFVQKLAAEYGVPFLVQRAERFVGQDNVEAWARKQRYEFLEVSRQQLGASVIVTAHHQRDQAETVLYKIFTGRFDVSLQAMRHYCPERFLFRPFLNLSKQAIQDYAGELQLAFVQDETNEDLARARNWIRHEILVRVREELNPQVDHSLSKLEDYLRRDEDFFDELASKQADAFGQTICQDEVTKLHPALAWRVLRSLAARQCGDDALKVSRVAYDRLLRLLGQASAKARTVELGFGVAADCSQGGVLFFQGSGPALDPQPFSYPGKVEFGDFELSAKVVDAKHDSESAPECSEGIYLERFCAKALAGESLFVRLRRDGDEMRVMGRGRRKLKKMFQEQGLMLTLRNRLPIVECDSGILWVPGVARSDIAPVRADTTLVLELTCCNRK